jgi:hypothetical protein
MISERAKGLVFIWELHDHLYRFGPGTAYHITLAKVTARCAELNAECARLHANRKEPP